MKNKISESVKPKEYKLSSLEAGDKFKIVGLDTFRNLYIKSITGTSVCIGGEMLHSSKEENEQWKRIPSNYCIALSCIVNYIE